MRKITASLCVFSASFSFRPAAAQPIWIVFKNFVGVNLCRQRVCVYEIWYFHHELMVKNSSNLFAFFSRSCDDKTILSTTNGGRVSLMLMQLRFFIFSPSSTRTQQRHNCCHIRTKNNKTCGGRDEQLSEQQTRTRVRVKMKLILI